MYLSVDIETARNEEASDYFSMGMARPDARLKYKDKIAESINKQFNMCGLKWWVGKVCGITAKTESKEFIFNQHCEDERDILCNFAVTVNRLSAETTVNLVGKSSGSFDFPFLVGRYMKHDLGIPEQLMVRQVINDVDQIFAPYGRNNQTSSLSDYAWGLNIAGKLDGQTGAMVQGWYDAGDFDKIKEYCEQDVNIVFEMVRRYRPFST